MSKRKAFTKTALLRAAQLAKAEGVAVRLWPDGSLSVSPVPDDPAQSNPPSELELWRERHAERKAEQERKFGPLRKMAFVDNSEMAWRKHRARDDGYLTPAKEAQARKAVRKQWESDLINSELNSLEDSVLSFLAKHPDEKFSPKAVKHAGPATVERLVIRGFIEVSSGEMRPSQTDQIWITETGKREARRNASKSAYGVL